MNAIFPCNKLKTSTINITQTTSASSSQPMITKKGSCDNATAFSYGIKTYFIGLYKSMLPLYR